MRFGNTNFMGQACESRFIPRLLLNIKKFRRKKQLKIAWGRELDPSPRTPIECIAISSRPESIGHPGFLIVRIANVFFGLLYLGRRLCEVFVKRLPIVGKSGSRVDRLQERKTMEVGVPGIDSSDSMFSHQDRRLRIIKQVAAQGRQALDHLCGHICMPLGGNQ